ncbi:hypothetical protein K491DRAFT_676001 [Lophiostoma macrostomum CBS 122681]|uniref:Uncharacterized protein n=1 Tax=Lophiostoma macrostomum CBS 122681 TaxID=1314788 RepID=A0A6A6TFP2_9PLEO|nr:hypothetical protein K491DRAFT_676001 [Lophiostoma macrostomum CBS 122681]
MSRDTPPRGTPFPIFGPSGELLNGDDLVKTFNSRSSSPPPYTPTRTRRSYPPPYTRTVRNSTYVDEEMSDSPPNMFSPYHPDTEWGKDPDFSHPSVPDVSDAVTPCFQAIKQMADASNDRVETASQLAYTVYLFQEALRIADVSTTSQDPYFVLTPFGAMCQFQLRDMLDKLYPLLSETLSAARAEGQVETPNHRSFSDGWIAPSTSGGKDPYSTRKFNRAVSLDSDPTLDRTERQLGVSGIRPLSERAGSTTREGVDEFAARYFPELKKASPQKAGANYKLRSESSLNTSASVRSDLEKVSEQLANIDLEQGASTLEAQTERAKRNIREKIKASSRHWEKASTGDRKRFMPPLGKRAVSDRDAMDLTQDPVDNEVPDVRKKFGEKEDSKVPIAGSSSWLSNTAGGYKPHQLWAARWACVGPYPLTAEQQKKRLAACGPDKSGALSEEGKERPGGMLRDRHETAKKKSRSMPNIDFSGKGINKDREWEVVGRAEEDWELVEDEGKKEVQKYLKRK